MESKNYIVIIAIVLASILLSGCIVNKINPNDINQNEVVPDESNRSGNNLSVACWNLQIFGLAKASNETLLNYYAEKLDDFDIFIVQEIRDASGGAIEIFAEKFPNHHYIISKRAGRSSSKEQYAVFYNIKATLIDSYDYTFEYQQDIQRPPLKVTFTSNNWTFSLYTIHTQPDNVSNELSILETITGKPLNDTIILGDLNADGKYYDEENIAHYTDWLWVVSNDIDTTVAPNDNTYDRIIINNATLNNFISVGIINDITKMQSDHYIVYAVFSNEFR